MSVVVEGIETNEQLELVGADGTVTEAQGYLFSPPVTATQIRQLLKASHGSYQPDHNGGNVKLLKGALSRLGSA
jgi:sensor c-di-GMP phosphodiesterase-like protein